MIFAIAAKDLFANIVHKSKTRRTSASHNPFSCSHSVQPGNAWFPLVWRRAVSTLKKFPEGKSYRLQTLLCSALQAQIAEKVMFVK